MKETSLAAGFVPGQFGSTRANGFTDKDLVLRGQIEKGVLEPEEHQLLRG